MAKEPSPERLPPPNLIVSRIEAHKQLSDRIAVGAALREAHIRFRQDYDDSQGKFQKWNTYNIELLSRLFSNEKFALEYEGTPTRHLVWGGERESLDQQSNKFRETIAKQIVRLESILDRLDLVPEWAPAVDQRTAVTPAPSKSRQVFIVHGHDEAAKDSVARFLDKLGLDPVILHEQPNKGRTIIEKFEDHAGVAFAVILLTPDDVGAPAKSPKRLRSRARQNVILELGFFMGKIGRPRVCALYTDRVEIPSDYKGVLFILLDPKGGWQLKLAKEIRHAGIDIDLNRGL
jgi:predicted nucleotide-binding protein